MKEEQKALEAELAQAEADRDRLALLVPNPPADSVPDGATDDDALELRRVGDPPALAEPKEHTAIGRFDMDRAARIAGSRFGYWIGDAALVALRHRLALDRLVGKGFLPVLPPVLVREEALVGTGWLPADDPNVYEVESEGLYLAGTAEIPLGGLHLGELLDADELPLRYVGFSPCFRSEEALLERTRGGCSVFTSCSSGKAPFTRPEDLWDEHERTRPTPRRSWRSWRPVPCRRPTDGGHVEGVGQDVRRGDRFPSQDRYRETASISNTTDFQARRLGTRYRGYMAPEPVHTLNGTAVVDRMALAILENFQGAVPDVLTRYGAPSEVRPG